MPRVVHVSDMCQQASVSLNKRQGECKDVLPVAFSSAGWTGMLSLVYIVRTAEVIERSLNLFFDTELLFVNGELGCFLFKSRGIRFRFRTPDEGSKVELVVDFEGALRGVGGGHGCQ
jgi:hypothetical protein